LKIAGVVNNHQEALDIEDIVKVFLIEKRILNLSSLKTSKVLKSAVNPDIIKYPQNGTNYSKTSNKKIYKKKIM
jgi:hypothetical protein